MSETNKQTIRFVREVAMRKGSLHKLDGLYTDDYIYHGIPLLGDLRGPAAFKGMAAGFIDAVSGFEETVDDQIAEGNKVLSRISGRGSHTGEVLGAPPSGRKLSWRALVLSRFVDGKIAEEWAEFDGLSLFQQLGLVPAGDANVKQAVPFFNVTSIEQSVRYYVDGLGFKMTMNWVDNGKLRWCWLQQGGAALMLQEFATEGHDSWRPQGKPGEGVAIYFICKDALSIYREVSGRGIKASRPVVGNGMWVTSLVDPDGYRVDFESPTDVPEDTEYSDQ